MKRQIDIDIVERMRDGHLCSHFLLASYCYYLMDESPMTDHAFDRLCIRLAERWDFLDDSVYPHKRLIQRGSKSGFDIPVEKYPMIIQCGASDYLRRVSTGEFHRDIEQHLLPPPSSRRITRRTPLSVATAAVKPARIVRTPPKG